MRKAASSGDAHSTLFVTKVAVKRRTTIEVVPVSTHAYRTSEGASSWEKFLHPLAELLVGHNLSESTGLPMFEVRSEQFTPRVLYSETLAMSRVDPLTEVNPLLLVPW